MNSDIPQPPSKRPWLSHKACMRGIVGTIIFMVILLAVEIVSLVQGGHHVGWRIATGVAILVVSISNYFVFKDKSW
jgi:hypothetical protein